MNEATVREPSGALGRPRAYGTIVLGGLASLRLKQRSSPKRLLICFALAIAGLTLCSIRSNQVLAQLPGEGSNRPFPPLRIIGNIYYVGTNDLACYLITTPAGHILLDSGMEESVPIVSANIATLGFKRTDIKIIISSHAHYDHVGGLADMKAATGAQVFASAADAVILESGGTRTFFPIKSYKPVKVDRKLKDGEPVMLGGTVMTPHVTPGHTEGNTAWTTTVTEGGKTYNVVFVSSMSINDGVHMVNFPAWPKIAEAYAQSFAILKKLPCDVFLGPHASFFNLEAKVKQRQTQPEPNPFIDPQGYRNYIAAFEKRYQEQLQREKAP